MKLIAEPWDMGMGGYQLGNFPPGWSEWNDRYRDTLRAFWHGGRRMVGGFAERFAGSSDLFRRNGRKPTSSINFLAAHDGFTLRDVVSYNEKHNEANLEDNRDGHSHNQSWNCGVEGPTDDVHINALRRRQVRNLLTTLFFAQGVPMLLAGDELYRTQQGNNNAYCQDNEISWLDWSGLKADDSLLNFVRGLSALRREHPELRRDTFLKGALHASHARDISWWHASGHELADQEWNDPELRALGVGLGGTAPSPDLLLLLNPTEIECEFKLPSFKSTRLGRGDRYRASGGRVVGLPAARGSRESRAVPDAGAATCPLTTLRDPLIERLARARGIGDAYHSYKGELKHFTLTTKAAILRAMHCRFDDAATLEAQIREAEAAHPVGLLGDADRVAQWRARGVPQHAGQRSQCAAALERGAGGRRGASRRSARLGPAGTRFVPAGRQVVRAARPRAAG